MSTYLIELPLVLLNLGGGIFSFPDEPLSFIVGTESSHRFPSCVSSLVGRSAEPLG